MPSISSLLFVVGALSAAVSAHPVHDHAHTQAGALPGDWFHTQEHPVNALFRRADAPAAPLPAVGSPEWLKTYPDQPDTPGTLPSTEKDLPAAWVAAYKAAVANGKIPAIPPTTADYNAGTAKYASGFDPTSREVCSSYEQCYTATDLVDPPAGRIVISFDDGPSDGTDTLLQFLGQNHQRATHFMIGSNIRNQPDLFTRAFKQGGDIAVHTYTHPYMTSLSDYGVLAELGWTMQIIHDSTAGRVPRFWRPPFGDMDNRVRAIASEVFGLRPVMWNEDTNDWAMPDGQTPAKILASVTEWLGGDAVKAPKGKMFLEHELSIDTASVFINTTWPILQTNKWTPLSVAQIWGDRASAYANAASNNDVPTKQDIASAPQSVTVAKTSTLPPWVTTVSTTAAPSSSSSAPLPPANTQAPGGAGGAGSPVPAPSSPSSAPPSSTDSSDSSAQTPAGDGTSAAALTRPHLALAAAVAFAVAALA